MRTVLASLIGAATVAGLAQPAAAQTAADRADARCMLVLQAIARDPKNKEAAQVGLYFYMGRLDARGGIPRLEPILLAEAKTITSAEKAKAELDRCGAELNKRTMELKAVNDSLRAHMQPTPTSAPAPAPAKK